MNEHDEFSANLLAVAVPLRISAVRRSRDGRGRTRSEAEAAFDLDAAIDCRVFRPRIMPMNDENHVLLSAGFHIELDSGVRLVWARFHLESRSKDVRFISVHPRKELTHEAFGEQLKVDEVGGIDREPVKPGAESSPDVSFSPAVYGACLGEGCVHWDFLPQDRNVPLGCDRLAFTLAAPMVAPPRFEARLMLLIATESGLEDYVELAPQDIQADYC